MKAQKIFWIIMLSLLLLIEIILGGISCNPTSDFHGMSTYTIQTQTTTSVDSGNTTSSTVSTMLSIMSIIFIVAVVLGAVSFMGMQN